MALHFTLWEGRATAPLNEECYSALDPSLKQTHHNQQIQSPTPVSLIQYTKPCSLTVL